MCLNGEKFQHFSNIFFCSVSNIVYQSFYTILSSMTNLGFSAKSRPTQHIFSSDTTDDKQSSVGWSSNGPWLPFREPCFIMHQGKLPGYLLF